ncbi:unnamed protein product [Umbelopsis vinacea]
MADPTSEIAQATQTVVNSSIVVPASTEALPQRKRQNDQDPQKRPRLDMSQDGQRRGKRMFGVLMGTLNKFKNDTSKKTSAEKQREEIETKLQEKLERERSELASKAKKDKEEHIERIQEKKRQSKKEITQKVDLTNAKHRVYLSAFIKTKTEPQLLFRPAKLSDDQTAQIDGQVEKAKIELEDLIRKQKEENANQPEKTEEDEKMEETHEVAKEIHANKNGDTTVDVKMDDINEVSREAPALSHEEVNPTLENAAQPTSNELDQRGDILSQNGDVVDYEGEP